MRNRTRVKMIKDHDFYCTRCGNKGIPICRTSSNAHGGGHLKKLYCFTCKDETNHVECIEGSKYCLEDFQEEFEAGNFTEDGQRKMSISKLHVLQAQENYVEQEQENNIEEWLDIFCPC